MNKREFCKKAILTCSSMLATTAFTPIAVAQTGAKRDALIASDEGKFNRLIEKSNGEFKDVNMDDLMARASKEPGRNGADNERRPGKKVETECRNIGSSEIREKLKAAQQGIVTETNMKKLFESADKARNTDAGLSGETIRSVNKGLSKIYPDGTHSQVWAAGHSAVFFRYAEDGTNAVAAWFYKDHYVTSMTGPILLSLFGFMRDMTTYSVSKNISHFNARELTRAFCVPVRSKDRYLGTFRSVNKKPYIFETEYTRIEIKYSKLPNHPNKGESIFTVTDLKNNTIVFEGSKQFRLITC